jgi:hypothetical protein
MVMPETERPDAIETVPIDIVYEPVIEPELFETVPDAVTVAPNNDNEPFASNDQLLLFVYEPARFNVVPPSTNAPLPVSPPLGLHDIVKPLIVMPVATVRLFSDIVYEPDTTPEVLTIDPEAATVVPKIDVEPLALNVQVDVFV